MAGTTGCQRPRRLEENDAALCGRPPDACEVAAPERPRPPRLRLPPAGFDAAERCPGPTATTAGVPAGAVVAADRRRLRRTAAGLVVGGRSGIAEAATNVRSPGASCASIGWPVPRTGWSWA